MSFYVKAKQTTSNPSDPTPNPITAAFISDWNFVVLSAVAQLSLGPTVTSRYLFMWSTMCMLSINTTNLDPLFTSVFTYRTNEDKWIDACCYQATKRILQLMNSTSQTLSLIHI